MIEVNGNSVIYACSELAFAVFVQLYCICSNTAHIGKYSTVPYNRAIKVHFTLGSHPHKVHYCILSPFMEAFVGCLFYIDCCFVPLRSIIYYQLYQLGTGGRKQKA